MIYQCCDTARRAVLVNQNVYNGIDYLEVADGPVVPQSLLYVYFFHPLTPGQLEAANFQICGGERIRNIAIVSVVDGSTLSPPPGAQGCSGGSPPDGSNLLVVTVAGPGDFSTYTLRLVDNTPSAGETQPPPYFDPVYSEIKFSFKVDCPAFFDCKPSNVCPPQTPVAPTISYLAKDYASFRSLLLDRLGTILPAWTESHAADLGIVLVELLAYLGDYLSYQQDAVATEAYLGTARLRTSLRRHARLVDYLVNDGCNARAWIHFDVTDNFTLNKQTTSQRPQQLLTQGSDPGPIIHVPSDAYTQALGEGPTVFELMENAVLFAAHNQMQLYGWGDRQCCLPAGATSAWLSGAFPNLAPGMVLIFVEVKGPLTGATADADPTHRCAVRLTKVELTDDPLGSLFLSPPSTTPFPVTRIEWGQGDALPFAVCLSSSTGGNDPTYIDDVTIVLGNNALADNGQTILDETLPPVLAINAALVASTASGGCQRCDPAPAQVPATARYNPQLASGPMTFADPYQATASATAALNTRDLTALSPAITLTAEGSLDIWTPEPDLLHSPSDAKQFVAETADDGTATLRFGNGTFGEAVVAGEIFHARYRVGNGSAGNVGMNSLCRIASDGAVLSGPVITAVTNPMPATGGVDPETLDSIRRNAPQAFNIQNRAVTTADYGTMALRVDPTLQQAKGTFRWTGSWQTVFIAAEPKGTEIISDTERATLITGMEQYRMAGHDVDVDVPVYVSLEIDMTVCVSPGYIAADVYQAILQALGTQPLPDGQPGLFAQSNFSFGQPVYLSPVIAAVQSLAGVTSVTVTAFQRQGQDSTNAVNAGVLYLQPLEIARLENDPNYPEHGILNVTVLGGS